MIPMIISFLVLINPIALFLYLEPVMKELSHKDFLKVLFKATIISFAVFVVFLGFGDILFQRIFQINFESFRIFGGVLIFAFAFIYVIQGREALIIMRENLDDLASEIALPFMVGGGTISLTILTSHNFALLNGITILGVVLSINYFSVVGIKLLKNNIPSKKLKVAFDKNMQILLRLNGFFLGAIGINMIITGINNLFF